MLVSVMAALKGKNQIEKFRKIAERLASQILPLKGVAGIIFIGGLTRRFADKYSDIDIIVFLEKRDKEMRKHIRKMGSDTQNCSGIDIDIEVHFLVDFKRWKLEEFEMWDFSKAEVVFDPTGEINRMLKAKLHVPKSFWVKRLAVYAEYLKWYCCPPEEDLCTVAETWIERGDLLSAHYSINYATDLVLSILFALNKEFMPPQKWRIFYSYQLEWLPADFRRLLEESILVKDFSAEDLKRRIKALRRLWKEIILKIEHETKFTLDSLHAYYVKTMLRQA
jgi:predicted nucleotidyltransferase